MPLYEYRCRKCEHRFEELVMSRDDETRCPSCHGTALERMMSVFAVSQGGLGDQQAMGSCGTCGDPRGPGACRSGSN